ncbi:DNA-binding protein H-NS [Paraburkholderia steynii]|uniref:DNA-binding protein H-NS n=1 Tax=Paraburkholderia steynii TaxID=1245441 RepID=A0A7Z7B1Y9_9BURK|nr:DNA-binding protein H-NS [Paraburkholderia steynii]
MPQWLKQAVSAGQSLEHFAVERPALAMTESRPKVDWSQDPFAGGPLAAVQSSHRNL